MIVFTLTNKITQTVYVGTTRDSAEERWEQYVAAAEEGMEAPLYDDIREHGAANFLVEEWAVAEDRDELRELTRDALETFQGINLQGVKTAAGKKFTARRSPRKSKPADSDQQVKPAAAVTRDLEALGVDLNSLNDTPDDWDDATDFDTPLSGKQESKASVEQQPKATAANPADPQSIVSASTAENATGSVAAMPQQGNDKPVAEAPAKGDCVAPAAQSSSIDRSYETRYAARHARELAERKEMALLMAKIDARRRPGKAAAAKKAARKAAASPPAEKTQSKEALSLAAGRASSSSKEKRIREGIAKEQEARITEKNAREAAERKEMALLMARIDARRKPTKAAQRKQATPQKPALDKVQKSAEMQTDATTRSAAQGVAASPSPAATAQRSSAEATPKPAVGRTSSSSREKRIREGIARDQEARITEKNARQAAEREEMALLMARIDARRATSKSAAKKTAKAAKNAKTANTANATSTAKATQPAASDNTTAAIKRDKGATTLKAACAVPGARQRPGAKSKLSTGRVSSSEREKRIREAIELEKQARTAAQRTREAEQAAEMREIMARIDARSKGSRRGR